MPKAPNEAIDQWLLSLKKVLAEDSFPIIATQNRFIFVKINVGSLVTSISEVVSPVKRRDLSGRIFPRFELLVLFLIYVIKMF